MFLMGYLLYVERSKKSNGEDNFSERISVFEYSFMTCFPNNIDLLTFRKSSEYFMVKVMLLFVGVEMLLNPHL